MTMPEEKRIRASSSKALKAISALAKLSSAKDDKEDSEETDEHASDLSGSVYENNSEADSSTNSSPNTEAVESDEPTTGSEDEDDSAVVPRRSVRVQSLSAAAAAAAARVTVQSSSGVTETVDRAKASSPFSPFCWYLTACRRRKTKSIKQMAIEHFSQAIEALKFSFNHTEHPFALHASVRFKEAFQVRQDALFATTFMWQPFHYDDTLAFLPQPLCSPMLSLDPLASTTKTASASKEHIVKRLKRFEFDKEKNLLYVGGYVKCIAWCPTRMYQETVSTDNSKDPTYLAVATYPSPGTRVLFSDPPKIGRGLIQIWNCGRLGLLKPPTGWQPEPHIFIVHDWGHVMHMCWLPLSVTLAVRKLCTANAPTPWIHRTMGHLIVACQDGYVRIISVPRFIIDSVYFGNKRHIPLYRLNDQSVMTLSPSVIKHPDWIGWPTQVHVRARYPNRLFVGYSKGHVALYDLSCVNPMYFDMKECHLAPVRLFHLVNGPVRSMSLNCLNGRMLLVQGMDFHIRVWDIEDNSAQTAESPEMSYTVVHGLPGSELIWHSRGDMWMFSRECTFQRRALINSRGVQYRNYADLITQSDNLVGMAMFASAAETLRHLIPLGLQSVTRLDMSEPLNAVLCATDRGRLELILCTLDGRTKVAVKERYLPQMRIPICQWTFDVVEQVPESLDDVFRRLTASKCYILPASATHTPAAVTNDFSDPNCPDCASDRNFCWHKLWSNYKLTVEMEENVSAKPFADFLKTPFLSITEARFCPNVESATWIAMGTACGFVQFYCADFLYLSEFSQLLNEPDVRTSSSCLNSTRMPDFKASRTPYVWQQPRVKVGVSNADELAKRRAMRVAREALPKGVSHPSSRTLLVKSSRRRDTASSSDSDHTEAMTEDDNTDQPSVSTSSNTNKRKRKGNGISQLIFTDSDLTNSSDTDRTEPCNGE